jgi:L-alanine-DL-glutamate epimerase-like enolase superfamily enzyme
MRVGSMDDRPHVSAARVKAARKALGPDVELMVDAHGTYTVAEAKRFARWWMTATLPGSKSRSSPMTAPAWPSFAPRP